MVNVEHNACLSTSTSFSVAPPPAGEVLPRSRSQSKSELRTAERRPRSGGTDYVLVLAYVIIYLEVGWLIFMVLRFYSRD